MATTPAHRHSRVRRDHRAETAQDVCEAVLTLREKHGEARNVELARHLGVSAVTVSKTVARLSRDGWLRAEPYRAVELTPEGERLARDARERHELVLSFLRWLGVPEESAETDAEGIEHHVSEATLSAMRARMA